MFIIAFYKKNATNYITHLFTVFVSIFLFIILLWYSLFMYISLKVTANAKKEKIEKVKEDTFIVYVKQKAERNMANTKVCEIIAKYYNLPFKSVSILNKHTSPSKLLVV